MCNITWHRPLANYFYFSSNEVVSLCQDQNQLSYKIRRTVISAKG